MRLVAGALVVLALLGCACGDFMAGARQGFDEGFTTEYRRTFVEACVEGKTDPALTAYCACAADQMLARYDTVELMAISAAPEDPANDAKITAAIESCGAR
ncbi:MAG: hypothetical protein ACOZNI_35270 [Myxococcota bacterium]